LSFEDRIQRIQNEISFTIQTEFIKTGIFSNSYRDFKNIESSGILHLNSNSPLAKNYLKRNDVLKRDLLLNKNLDENLTSLDEKDQIYLTVPIRLHGEITGLLFTGEKRRGIPYFKDDIEYLITAGTLLLQMIENEVLFTQSILRGKYEKELDHASYVQMRLFPANVPFNRGFDSSIYYRPFNKVTGDIIDFVPIDEHKTAIIIGDITGHGLPAAMVHSAAISMISALILEGHSLQEVLNTLNSFLIYSYRGHELITLFACIYNKNDYSLEYINAGHPMPYVISREDKSITRIESRGHILGVMENPFYVTNSIFLKPGSQLFLYTDGIVEIQNDKTQFNIGSDYLEKYLVELLDATIEEKSEHIVHYIEETGQKNISDDITLLFLETEK
jgi:hypothetical protein